MTPGRYQMAKGFVISLFVKKITSVSGGRFSRAESTNGAYDVVKLLTCLARGEGCSQDRDPELPIQSGT